jgi:hypothetical protein
MATQEGTFDTGAAVDSKRREELARLGAESYSESRVLVAEILRTLMDPRPESNENFAHERCGHPVSRW